MPKGMTENVSRAGTNTSAGANQYNVFSTWLGVISSLNKNLMPSATGCSRPNGPTRLGPTRSCINALTLRSANSMIIRMRKLTAMTNIALVSRIARSIQSIPNMRLP
ncbi:MAG: hypothetical protein BWY83_02984 [bacterium ADurb.Bin478]|nr:MAG: hypothetical protein BWY83_02984 [bacterium ADurb.Bin478]